VTNGAPGVLGIVDQALAVGGDLACGGGIASWNASWDVNATATATDTTLTITA
jgi:hypothetical protein